MNATNVTTGAATAAAIMDLLQRGEAAEAAALTQANIAGHQHDPAFLLAACNVARELRDLTAAKGFLHKLLALAPNDSNTHEIAYKVAYDDLNLPAAMGHVAMGALCEPSNVYMQQLALMLSLPDSQQQPWTDKLQQQLQGTAQDARSHWRTALILAASGRYEASADFLRLAKHRLAQETNSNIHPTALANDLRAVEQLARKEPVLLPAHADASWQAYAAEMQPCPLLSSTDTAPYRGPAATVIVTSHFSSKLVVSAAKAPPNTQLLAETLASFSAHAQLPPDWPIIFCFDAPQTPQAEAEALYVTGLQKLARHGLDQIRIYRGAGLRQVFLDVFKDITTPYFMMLEHDWLCARPLEPLGALATMMDAHPFVHHVRFCRHHMHINRTDWYLMPEPRVKSVTLTATPTYSNNPSLTRTAKFKRDWLPRVLASSHLATTNGGAGGLEENIFMASFQHMRRWGVFANIMAEGTYLIGQPNDAPRIIHTGI